MNLLDTVPLVIDFETTGMDYKEDRAVEVATVRNKVDVFETLINPGIEIPYQASAVHHILDCDVLESPTWAEVKPQILAQDFGVIVAHNASFDMEFFAQDGGLPDKPVICTWRMAKKIIPDLPSYTNMGLNYYLRLGRPLTAHRALADAKVTSALYHHLLGLAAASARVPGVVDQEGFLAWLAAPIMEKYVGFGKHRNRLWTDLAKSDPGYLKWCLDKSDVCQKNPDTKFTIETLLGR
jgi:exodeoxyribonuclease X